MRAAAGPVPVAGRCGRPVASHAVTLPNVRRREEAHARRCSTVRDFPACSRQRSDDVESSRRASGESEGASLVPARRRRRVAHRGALQPARCPRDGRGGSVAGRIGACRWGRRRSSPRSAPPWRVDTRAPRRRRGVPRGRPSTPSSIRRLLRCVPGGSSRGRQGAARGSGGSFAGMGAGVRIGARTGLRTSGVLGANGMRCALICAAGCAPKSPAGTRARARQSGGQLRA